MLDQGIILSAHEAQSRNAGKTEVNGACFSVFGFPPLLEYMITLVGWMQGVKRK